MLEIAGGGSFGKKLLQMGKTIALPLRTKEMAVYEWINRTAMGKNAEALAKAMIEGKGQKQLEKMIQLGPKSQKLIPMLTTFIAIITGGELRSSNRIEKAEPGR